MGKITWLNVPRKREMMTPPGKPPSRKDTGRVELAWRVRPRGQQVQRSNVRRRSTHIVPAWRNWNMRQPWKLMGCLSLGEHPVRDRVPSTVVFLYHISAVSRRTQMSADNIPWDIYVDDRKVQGDYCLGFLEIPNTASFLHKLYCSRYRPPDAHGRTHVTREVHWNRPHLDSSVVAMKWIDCVSFKHRKTTFSVLPWPHGEAKELVILRFARRVSTSERSVGPIKRRGFS